MSPVETLSPTSGRGLRLLLALLVVALNLRGAITCVGPVLDLIQQEFDLSSPLAGLLASLPLFAFGLLSPYAAPLARRLGLELAILVALLILGLGLLIRYADGALSLYLGTVFIGIGIAINNVLLPGLLHRDFSRQLAFVTALFTMVLVTVGGLGSALSVPLAETGGWRFSLVAWLAPVLLGVVAWLPQLRHNSKPQTSTQAKTPLWGNALAWQVSLFMGGQSMAFYVMIAWFPSMMADLQGISAARAGWLLFIYQIFVLGAVMLIPLAIHRLADQRWIGVFCGACLFVGYGGLYLAPAQVLTWMIIMGVGGGGALVLAITLFGLRAGTTSQAVALSGMAQAVGYLMAALLPVLIGYLRDLSQGWDLPLQLMLAVCLMQMVTGYLSGRPLKLPEAPANAA
ncbi:MAG TPA: MFS transporter [Hyphomicrobiales bacterium]|nr:MFS transporter [Hyphomicrobiales bacterium]